MSEPLKQWLLRDICLNKYPFTNKMLEIQKYNTWTNLKESKMKLLNLTPVRIIVITSTSTVPDPQRQRNPMVLSSNVQKVY